GPGARVVCGGESSTDVRHCGGAFGVGLESGMKTAINLLPSSLRRSQMARRRLTQWGAVIGVVLAVGWAWHYRELREDRVLARQLEVLEREHEPMRRVVQELGQMRAKLDELESQEKDRKSTRLNSSHVTISYALF